MGTFDDRVVIVTGGAQGIGAATAMEFAREGAMVAVADINADRGRATVGRINDVGLKALYVQADVARSADCRRVVAETVAAFGAVDILFNNAAIQPLDSFLNVEHTPEEMWDRIIDVNLKSYFLMSKYAIPEMRRRGAGVIINTASVQGLQSQRLVPAYAASKGGVLSLTQEMSLDYAAEGIRVLAVCPGSIDTEMLRTAAAHEGNDVDATVRRIGSDHPIGRIGTGQDIANLVLFLASEKASFMTGEYVCIDGGYMAQGAWASAAGAADDVR